jgi:multisubunit Na+/H+ antiporter MnhB subunit
VTASFAFDALLCLLLVLAGLGAVGGARLFTAVVFFIVYGLFVAVAWARLGAVDVALAEAAIGAGLTGVLLVRAVAGPQAAPTPSGPGGALRAARIAIGAGCAGLFVLLAVTLPQLRGGSLAAEVERRLPVTGVDNPVTAVLLNFRGYDTLLETVVLLIALLAAWSVAPDAEWRGRPGLPEHARGDGVLASFARLLPPMGLLVGLHLFWAGASRPGGAFQAGTILAAVWLLAAMGGAARPPEVTHRRVRILLVLGPALFLAVAMAALPWGGFLVFPPAYAKALVLAVEAALTVSIAATLALLVIGPAQGRGASA